MKTTTVRKVHKTQSKAHLIKESADTLNTLYAKATASKNDMQEMKLLYLLLLKAGQGTHAAIKNTGITLSTANRFWKRYLVGGLDMALNAKKGWAGVDTAYKYVNQYRINHSNTELRDISKFVKKVYGDVPTIAAYLKSRYNVDGADTFYIDQCLEYARKSKGLYGVNYRQMSDILFYFRGRPTKQNNKTVREYVNQKWAIELSSTYATHILAKIQE